MIRIIGDIHGDAERYAGIVRGCEYSIQVGDLGFRRHYEEIQRLVPDLDPARHVFIPGNHDDYNALPDNALGDFGMHELAEVPFFFIRGALSIDQEIRVPGLDWFENEELTMAELESALDSYITAKPAFVISHTCPQKIKKKHMGFNNHPSRTGQAMDAMLEYHQPKLWIFGHFHKDRRFWEHGTQFVCLAPAQVMLYASGLTLEQNIFFIEKFHVKPAFE